MGLRGKKVRKEQQIWKFSKDTIHIIGVCGKEKQQDKLKSSNHLKYIARNLCLRYQSKCTRLVSSLLGLQMATIWLCPHIALSVCTSILQVSFLIGTPDLLDQPRSLPCLTLIISSKVPTTNTFTLRVGASGYEFLGGYNSFSQTFQFL